jgi:hypothetical protein
MANVPAVFWQGSGSAVVTSLGIFDDEDAFSNDAPLIAAWVCSRLGYPIMAVELQSTQLYDCFSEAILEYSAQVNEFNMRDNMLGLQGRTTASSLTHQLITGGPLPMIIELSEAYGTEAGAGGNVDWKRGFIDTTMGQSIYDLQALWANPSESGNRIEIRRIYHDRAPAIVRGGFGYGDIGAGPTDGTNNLLGEFGWQGYDGGLNSFGGSGTAGQFIVMPVFETLLRTQAVEFNDQVRRSQYSFELINNKIRLFPLPTGERLWFEYLVKQDKFGAQSATSGSAAAGSTGTPGSVVSDMSNAPYNNMPYGTINDVGRRWIQKMTLALAKETLGRILSKYESIPAPNLNDGFRMDGPTLRQESEKEKATLWEQLRESLEQSARHAQLEKAKDNELNSQEILKLAPMPFRIF